MAQQNIYDNEIFFAGYKKIRDNKVNANNLFEIPALFSMMPELKGKRVLDEEHIVALHEWFDKESVDGMLSCDRVTRVYYGLHIL